jgi:hypothetical protein
MVNVMMKANALTGRERPQETDFNEARRVVRVLPSNEQIRKYIKHPVTRVGFLAEGASEWPNDVFTKRRIADGDVSVEAAPAVEEQRAIEQQKDSKAIDKSGAKAADKSKTE